jgi:endogenous inhibitor of DNA gyrase (YacG/DUF329 family)
MHWDRNHVNPLLALRNAVCNDRWREMWQKALKHSHQQRAFHRSARTEQQRRSLLIVCNPSLPDSSPSPLPSAASQGLSFPVSPPALVSPAARPSSSRPCTEGTSQTVGKRMKSSHQTSAKRCAQVCPCGTPLLRLKGHRTKAYCSDRCRMRAYRERQQHILRLSPPVPAITRENFSHQKSPEMSAEKCPCGMPLVHLKGHRTKGYCSDRCRQRAYRERQRWG